MKVSLLSHTEHSLHKDPIKNGCSSIPSLGNLKHFKHNFSTAHSPDITRCRASAIKI